MPLFQCPSCRSTKLGESEFRRELCESCASVMEVLLPGSTQETANEEEIPPPPEKEDFARVSHEEKKELTIEFRATGEEYFRIWVVNMFLTLITLGIYAAWAKVRTRRYFYASTSLDGHCFDYTANPKAILKGNLLVAGCFSLYNWTSIINPYYPLVVMAVFGLFFPYLIWRSLGFHARNSVFRGLKFCFRGSLRETYEIFFGIPVLFMAPFVLLMFVTMQDSTAVSDLEDMRPFQVVIGLSMMVAFLIFPYWHFRRKKLFFANYTFGASQNTFFLGARFFYRTTFLAILIAICFSILFALSSVALIPMGSSDITNMPVALGIGFVLLYVLMLIGMTALQQFWYAKIQNQCWEKTCVGEIRFSSTLKTSDLTWIRVSNTLAIFFSFGMLLPWAKVRRMKYILENLRVNAPRGFNNILAEQQEEVSALGDAATDFFDIDIAL